MSATDLTPSGIPHTLEYSLLPTIPETAKAYDVSISPDNNQYITYTGLTTLASTGSFGLPVSLMPQTQTFSISNTGSQSVFSDTKELTLSGRFGITVTTAMASTGLSAKLIGSWASLFDILQINCSNQPVETINNYGLLHNMLLNSTMNSAERAGPLTINMGCDPSTFNGIDLTSALTATVGTTTYFNFSIPLICVLGLNTASASGKLFPIGSVQNLQLSLTTASILPIATTSTTVTTQGIYTITLDQLNLNMKYIDVGDYAFQIFRNNLKTEKYLIRSQTYTNSTASIPTGSSGNVDLSLQLKNLSIKSMFWFFSSSRSLACPNGSYDCFNPSITSAQMKIGGIPFPQKALNPSYRPAECFEKYLQAYGALGLKTYGGSLYRSSYNAILPAIQVGMDSQLKVPANLLRDATAIIQVPNMHYEGVELERANGTLMSGVSTKYASVSLGLNLSQTTTVAITCYAYSLCDCILEIDPTTRILRSIY